MFLQAHDHTRRGTSYFKWLENCRDHKCTEKWRNLFGTILFNICLFFFFFLYLGWVSFHNHSRITVLQGKGEDISLTPHYHFHPLHRHLDISRAITAESSSLHIGSTRTRTGNLWFPSASR